MLTNVYEDNPREDNKLPAFFLSKLADMKIIVK